MSNIFVVNLLKRESEGFGFLIRQRDQKPYFSVWEIIKNGSADLSGKIRRGDIIIRVNGQDLANCTYENGLDVLRSVPPGSTAEFVFQAGSRQEVEQLDRMEREKNNMNNGFMSPLQRFKKKFVSCTTGNGSGNGRVNAQHNVPSIRNQDQLLSMPLYGEESPRLGQSRVSLYQNETSKTNGHLRPTDNTSVSISTPSSPVFYRVERNTTQPTTTAAVNSTAVEIQLRQQPSTVDKTSDSTNLSTHNNKSSQEILIASESIKYIPIQRNMCPFQHQMNSLMVSGYMQPITDNTPDNSMETIGLRQYRKLAAGAEQKVDFVEPKAMTLDSRVLHSKSNGPSSERDILEKMNLLEMADNLDKKKSQSTRTSFNLPLKSYNHRQRDYENQAGDHTPSQVDSSNSSPLEPPVVRKSASRHLKKQAISSKAVSTTALEELNRSRNALTPSFVKNRQDDEESLTSVSSFKVDYSSRRNELPEKKPKNTIKITQDGDDIRINIDGNIEIITSRHSDKRIISLSPQPGRHKIEESTVEVANQQDQQLAAKIEQNSDKLPLQADENNETNTDQTVPKKDEEINETIEKKILPAVVQLDEKKEPEAVKNVLEEKKEQLSAAETTSQQKVAEVVQIKVQSDGDKKSEKESNKSTSEPMGGDKIGLKAPPPNPVSTDTSGGSTRRESSLGDSLLSNKNKARKKGSKLRLLLDESTFIDTLHNKALPLGSCSADKCAGSVLMQTKTSKEVPKTKEVIMEEAIDFINQFYASVKREGSKTHKERLEEVVNSIQAYGTYEIKETELCFGARTAWRNASRCIGRIQWSKLQVFDARYVTTARGMFEAICNHLKYATNKGNIRSAITIFKQRTEPGHDFRVWNSQFIQYAGYKLDDQTIIGDRSQLEFTDICTKLGWKPRFTEFDVLPLVLQANGQDPEWFEIPPDLVLETNIVHPVYDWFKDLNLKWYCVPGVTSMLLDVGGIEFTAIPFNGWYMGTEIGRDLADINRYNKLPIVAEKMGLDTKSNSSLWRDKALVEINHAVLYSFQKATVTIIDHHTASESFMKHYENENQLRGGCPVDWVWVTPPLSSHLSPIFHLETLNYILKPSYEYQEPAWKTHVWKQKNPEEKAKRAKRKVYFSDIARAVKFSAKLMGKALAKRVKCTILYATETGKSERFAKMLSDIFKHAFDAKVLCMKDYDVVDLGHETLLLIVTSTFGNGDPPENGEEFKKILNEMKKDHTAKNGGQDSEPNEATITGALNNVRFSVFGLGNSSYPKFCSYAKFLDQSLVDLGAERIHALGLGDELCGQEEFFRKWSVGVFKSAIDAFCIDSDKSFFDTIDSNDDFGWNQHKFRLTLVENKQKSNLCESLTKLHNRTIMPTKLIGKRNLLIGCTDRSTLCVELSTHGLSSEMSYKPGDHIGLLASNRKELVESILAKITNAPPPDQLVKVELLKEKPNLFGVTKEWIIDDRFPEFTLRTAFTNFLDITSPPTQDMLMYLSTQTTVDRDRIQLEKLGKDHIAYEEWRMNGSPNLAEVLDDFPSVKPNASLLVTQLPKLQPRFYSISSSPKLCDDIHLTLGVVEIKRPNRSIHYGVCSKWLDNLELNEIVPGFIRGALSFRLPADKTCPIVMVGAGTGIAPYRSFWQERKIDREMSQDPEGVNGRGWGPMILYFGCRQRVIDELYKDEIEQLIKERVITAFYPAYSREPGQKKTYVQDLLLNNVSQVCDMIVKKSGHFYICGDVGMAAGVTMAFETGLQEYCKMSQNEAKDYIHRMKEENRFHEDIFGNSVMTTNQEANANNNTE